MTTSKTWAERVAEWRSSGQTSTAFCEGKPFTAGGLRHWATRLRKMERRDPVPASIRLRRVVRVGPPAPAVVAEPPPAAPRAGAAVIVELGAARVTVPAGFDRATLTAVLDVLSARGVR